MSTEQILLKMGQNNIVIALKGDSHEAFLLIYQQYWQKVYNFSRLYLTDNEYAKEIVQDVFVNLWENRSNLKEEMNLDGYLFIITRNTIFGQRKKMLNEQYYKETVLQAYTYENIDNSCEIEEQINLKELSRYLDEIINKLPDRQKEAFNLSRQQQLTYAEIAIQMGISEKGVEKLMSKALKTIKQSYSSYMLFLCL